MIKTVLRQHENIIYLNKKEGFKSMKKILSAILVAAMLLSTMGMVAFAAGEPVIVNGSDAELTEVWDGSVDTAWHDNADVTATEYAIDTAAELAGFAKIVNDGIDKFSNKTVKLTSNIDLAGIEWTPIGIYPNVFYGTFDGGNKKISNLNINFPDSQHVGLFGYSHGTIKNFTINNAKVIAKSWAAPVVGTSFGKSIENVTVTGVVTVDGRASDLAGIVGYAYSHIRNCHVIGDVGSYVKMTGSSSFVGGIAGYVGEGGYEIDNCSVKGINIIAPSFSGGIVGGLNVGSKVIDCAIENVNIDCNTRPAIAVGYTYTTEPIEITVGNNVTTSINGVPVEYPALDGRYPNVALLNGEPYTSITAAIADAKDDDTITLLDDTTIDTVKFSDVTIVIDLNDHTLNVTNTNADGTTRLSFNDGADVTFKNGTIDITGAKESAGIFFANAYDSSNGIIRFDNVDIVGNGYNSGYAVFYANSDDSEIHFINGTTVTLSNEQGASGGVIKSEGNVAKIVIDDSSFVLDNIARGFVKANFTITDSDITIQNSHKTALRNFNGTIEDSVINVYNCDCGIENDNTAPLAIDVLGNSSIKMTGCTTSDLYLANTNTAIKVSDTAELIVETSSIPEGANVTGNVVSKADAIYVQFEKKDDDTVEREKDIYDIVLVGVNAEKINELASADLTFAFDGTKAVEDGDLSYAITSKEGVTLSQTGIKGQEDRFMFNFNGVNGSYEETGNKIVLGQVTINGYGKYTFGMNATATTNAVYATEIRNNIVDGYTPAANLVLNGDIDNNGPLVGVIDKEITVPVQKLTINVTFPNAVTTANKELYQDMQVKIEGGNVKKTIALGNERNTIEGATVTVGDGFVVEIDLPYNTTYTVTVSGAGYRTATYSVVLTDDKELTFWNNVMDDMTEIEKDNANSKRTTSFLAGDIVKDNKINIYDLSAVVSYFGQIKLNEIEDGEDFAKYDLDRDGKIDAKDVAYVLVSWGN